MANEFKKNHAQVCEAWRLLSAVERATYLQAAVAKLALLTGDANKLAFAVLALVVLLAIAFFAVYRKTGTVTVGAIDIYLCLHNLKYIILLRLSPSFHLLSILSDTPPFFLKFQQT